MKEPAENAPLRLPMAMGRLIAPAVARENATAVREEPPPVVVTEVPGGVPGGQAGSPLGGIISGASRTGLTPAPPPIPEAQPPIRVGGRVKEPRLLSSVLPVYPPLARQSGVEGNVIIQADIDTAGNVVGMKVVSGPALLHQAAMDAVRRWKYEPSRLNDQPVPAQILVTVKFRL